MVKNLLENGSGVLENVMKYLSQRSLDLSGVQRLSKSIAPQSIAKKRVLKVSQNLVSTVLIYVRHSINSSLLLLLIQLLTGKFTDYLHSPNSKTPIEETMRALAELQR